MKKLLVMVFVSLVMVGCGGKDEETMKAATGERALRVRVWKAEKKDMPIEIKAVGTIEAEERVVLRSELNAPVTGLHVDEGDSVRKGALMAVLDRNTFGLVVERTEAELKRAKAELGFAIKDFERKEALIAEGMITRADYDSALAARDKAAADAERLDAALRLAKEDLNDSAVISPLDGYVEERFVATGSYLKEGDELFTIIDTDPVKVSVNVPEAYLKDLRKGHAVSLTVAAFPEREFGGIIYFINPKTDEGTRTVEVKARIKNPDGALRPGFFADVTIRTGVKKGIFLVPEKSVITKEAKDILYTVSGAAARLREVTLGERHVGTVEVLSGIDEGDIIVTDGVHGLSDGARIEIAE
ncbi:MAG: efflux RND transporter periplasmic adaptor subunit [Deltaproteobacteria bacterium]|nr:efflux RND transporter periplasmic adaptor subunit [Deltaproteobacteria bacterium]